MSDIPMPDAPASSAPSTLGKRKRGDTPPKPPTKKLKVNPDLEDALRSKEILRSMGVGQEYVNLLGRPLDNLTPREQSRLKQIRLDKWLIAGANEISDEVLTFWIAGQDPLYISDRATAVLPDWVRGNKTWYRLWWRHSPFTMPAEHCRMGRSQEEQIAAHWIDNTFQANRVGKPQYVVCELMFCWQMTPNTPLQMDKINMFGILWLFDQMGGDLKKLRVKLVFKDRLTNTDPGNKRDFPSDMIGRERRLMEILNRCLTEYKKHLDGVVDYDYTRYMSTAAALMPGNRDRLARNWHVDNFGREMDNSWRENKRIVGKFKVNMLKAFGKTWYTENGLDEDVDAHLRPWG